MSTLTADPGFPRGSVLGVTQKMYDAEPSDGATIVGVVKTFRDESPSTGVVLSNRTVDCIAVRNKSAGVLHAGTVARFKHAAVLSEVDATPLVTDVLVGVVDEYLPAGGVPIDEVFWLVVKGPASVSKPTASGIDAGQVVVCGDPGEGITYAGTVVEAGATGAGTTDLGVSITTSGAGTTRVRVLVKTMASS